MSKVDVHPLTPSSKQSTPTTEGIQIHPDRYYTDQLACYRLAIPKRTLIQARKSGKLRYARIAGNACSKGQWLIEWIERIAEGPRGNQSSLSMAFDGTRGVVE